MNFLSLLRYISEKEGEISFPPNTIVRLIENRSDGWCLVNYNGRKGLAPKMYLKSYSDPIRNIGNILKPKVI